MEKHLPSPRFSTPSNLPSFSLPLSRPSLSLFAFIFPDSDPFLLPPLARPSFLPPPPPSLPPPFLPVFPRRLPSSFTTAVSIHLLHPSLTHYHPSQPPSQTIRAFQPPLDISIRHLPRVQDVLRAYARGIRKHHR